MASFLNTGVLGQQVGSSLQVGSLRGEFTSFRDEVLANKKRRRTTTRAEVGQEEQYLSAADKARKAEVSATKATVAAQEKEALRIKREKQLAESEKTTGVKGGVDTSDIRPTGPGADKLKGITKVAKDATPVSQEKLSPETSNISDADRAFVQALSGWNQHIQGKRDNDINRGRGQTQGYLQNVVDAAKATGREDIISAVGGIEGILGQNNISARNVGQAKATTTKALGAIRGTLDIERILKNIEENPPKVDMKKSMGVLQSGMRKLASRGFGGRL